MRCCGTTKKQDVTAFLLFDFIYFVRKVVTDNCCVSHVVKTLGDGLMAVFEDAQDAIDVSTEVNLHVPALLPAMYCSDVQERLSLYKRLADAETREQLDLLREELVDRFGELPEPTRALLECHRVRIAARALGVARIDATHEAVQLQFVKNPPVDGAKVIDFIRKKGRAARLAGPEKLRVEAKMPAWQERAQAVKDILQQLAA